MKEWLVHSSKKPCTVKFKITTSRQTPIYLIGFDPLTPNTFYFKSRYLVTGQEEILINCPQTPNHLKIYAWSEGNYTFEVTSVSIVALKRIEPTDPWVIFLEKFCRQEALLKPGFYSETAVPFVLELRRMIYNENGTEHATPARISVDQPLIQVSKNKFDIMSIPERVIILLHEVAHNFINYDQDDEQESDNNGLDIYIDLGYPKIEAINAFANIMNDTEENYQRMLNLINI
jgi:hypothetical protein